MVTVGWVDDEHLLAIGRVVVAATSLETVLDHVVRSLLDDGPIYTEMVSSQGVSQPCDFAVRLASGATLVQGYTGFVYEGPLWASRINRAPAARLRASDEVAA